MDKKDEYLKLKKELEDLQEDRFNYLEETESLKDRIVELKKDCGNTNREINQLKSEITRLESLNLERRKEANSIQREINERYKNPNIHFEKEKELRERLQEISFSLLDEIITR